MLKNYISVALRNLINHKLYSVINIVGLAVGLAACVLIMLFVRDEQSYDTQWADAGRIHQLNTDFHFPGSTPAISGRVSGRAKEALEAYFPQDIEHVVRFNKMRTVMRRGESVFSEIIHWTDAEVLDVFDLVPVAGDLQAALHDNASLAINQSFAAKHFGTRNPIGEVLTVTVYDLQRDYRVAAVFEDLPHNTTLEFQALAMIDEVDFAGQSWEFGDWFSANGWSYVKLKAGVDTARINEQLKTFVDANIDVPSWLSTTANVKASDYLGYIAQPLQEVQLDAVGQALMKPVGDAVKIVAFSSIAGLILLVACINFINLSTAKATQRAREVALRKVMGAGRAQLVVQFLGESLLLVTVALLLGLVLVELTLPSFGAFFGKTLVLDYMAGGTIFAFLGAIIAIGVLAGGYPALVLSGFLPARVLKANKSAETVGSSRLRYSLVVFQFAISIGLIVVTGVIYGQMYYATNMDLGYNKDNLLTVLNVGSKDAAPIRQRFQDEVAKISGVTNVSATLSWSAGNAGISRSVRIPGGDGENISLSLQEIDHQFIDTYQVEVLAGRNYDRSRSTDGTPSYDAANKGALLEGSIIVNELALAKLGYGTPEEAIGRAIRYDVARDADGNLVSADLRIIGVISDMLFHQPRGEREAEAYYLVENNVRSVAVRFEGDPQQLVARMEAIWRQMAPSVPFQYEFSSEVVAAQFLTERHLATLLGTFALLAIAIACLGLYGLASFTAERRTKEIGIRKILGATVRDIVQLLVWQFSKPVLLANLIAWPIAAWAMMRWLETFPYRMDFWYLLPLCVFAGITTLAVAWATVGGNAAKVARANPINALRYE